MAWAALQQVGGWSCHCGASRHGGRCCGLPQLCLSPRLQHSLLPQVIYTAVLWGMGTALGEVPPYALSYHAAKAGKRSAEVEAMLGANGSGSGSDGE